MTILSIVILVVLVVLLILIWTPVQVSQRLINTVFIILFALILFKDKL